MGCSSTINKENKVQSAEKCFLDKFEKMNAKIQIYSDEKNDRMYKIISSKEEKDTATYFGWINFRIQIFKDISEAKTELIKIGTGNVDRFKAPEYIARYSNRIYSISTGCFNADRIEGIFRVFCDCIDLNKLKKEDVIAVECGGRLIPAEL